MNKEADRDPIVIHLEDEGSGAEAEEVDSDDDDAAMASRVSAILKALARPGDDEVREPTDTRPNPCCALLRDVRSAGDMVQQRSLFTRQFATELQGLTDASNSKSPTGFFRRRSMTMNKSGGDGHRSVGFYQDHMCRYICLECYAHLVVHVQVAHLSTSKHTAVCYMLPEFCARFIKRAFGLSSLEMARELFWFNNKRQVLEKRPEWTAELDQRLYPVLRAPLNK